MMKPIKVEKLVVTYSELFESRDDDDVYVDNLNDYGSTGYIQSGTLSAAQLASMYKFVLHVDMEGRFFGTFYSNNANRLRSIAKQFISVCWDSMMEEDGDMEDDDYLLDAQFELPWELTYLMMRCGDGCEWNIYATLTSDENADVETLCRSGLFPQVVLDKYFDNEI